MRATIAALQSELGCEAGSMLRYAGDTYAGGNRWVLAALWLGLWHRQVGDAAGLERALAYALSAQTNLGLLPEQVTKDGDPAWVVPLAWSHAMLLLAARPELSLAAPDDHRLVAEAGPTTRG
jgi:glucoamylase